MAAINAGTAGGRGVHALGDAFQQVLQGIQSIQEGFLAQERRVQELERKMQEDRQAMVARANDVAEVLTSCFEERFQTIEQRLEEMERRSLLSEGQESSQASAVERLANLEVRMEQLDDSTRRVLIQTVLPRVDALLNQLKTPSPHSTSTASSTSGAASAPLALSTASGSSPAPRPRAPSAGSAATPPLTAKRRKKLGNQLLQAADHGRVADVQKLLEVGADINYRDTFGHTPLMLAASLAHVNVVSLLLEKGSDVNARDKRRATALHFASGNDRSGRCASLLIRAGALVNSTNISGQTPLHCAAIADYGAAARELLAAGASTTVRDENGNTASERACSESLRRLLSPGVGSSVS